MSITFRCPNGHKLTCPAQRAGQAGKCPKCGATFHVPVPQQEPAEEPFIGPPEDEPFVGPPADEGPAEGSGFDFSSLTDDATQESAEHAGVGSSPGSGAAHESRGAGGSGFHGGAFDGGTFDGGTFDSGAFDSGAHEPAPAGSSAEGSGPQLTDAQEHESTTSETLVFLCPNGHKLNAPIRLQGKPGKCPHCGEKFLVPMLEEPQDAPGQDDFLDMLVEGAAPAAPPPPEATEPAPEGSGFYFEGLSGAEDYSLGVPQTSSHAMAGVFVRLWNQRGESGVVELYLKGGEILSPHWYAAQLSQPSFGMFAFQEQDGTHTMTAVQWDAIERIALRGLPHLPDGGFES